MPGSALPLALVCRTDPMPSARENGLGAAQARGTRRGRYKRNAAYRLSVEAPRGRFVALADPALVEPGTVGTAAKLDAQDEREAAWITRYDVECAGPGELRTERPDQRGARDAARGECSDERHKRRAVGVQEGLRALGSCAPCEEASADEVQLHAFGKQLGEHLRCTGGWWNRWNRWNPR